MFNTTFTGPSHIALYFWGSLQSCFVLLYAAGKIIDLRFFLELLYPADTFQNAVILFDYVIPHYFGQTAILAEQNKKKQFSPPACKDLFCLSIFDITLIL
jgi:hypothetical protein